jgi:hypothetical protein
VPWNCSTCRRASCATHLRKERGRAEEQ